MSLVSRTSCRPITSWSVGWTRSHSLVTRAEHVQRLQQESRPAQYRSLAHPFIATEPYDRHSPARMIRWNSTVSPRKAGKIQRIYTSPFPLPPFPPPTSLFDHHFPPDFLHSPQADLPAYIDGITDLHITQSEVRSLALRLSYGLTHRLKLKKGDVIIVFSPNSIEYALTFFAAQASGLIVSPASASYTASELAYQIKDSGAKIVFTTRELAGICREALDEQLKGRPEECGLICMEPHPLYAARDDLEVQSGATAGSVAGGKPVAAQDADVSAGQQKGDSAESLPGQVDYLDMFLNPEGGVEPGWHGVPFAPGDEHKTCVLCYSSGTTGLPKGVETTHWNLIAMQTIFSVAMEKLNPKDKDKALGLLPFSHIFGLVLVLLHPLTMKIPVITLPKFTPHTFFSSIISHKITWSFIVPPLVSLLANLPGLDKYDLSSLRGLLSGAAPMSGEVAKRAMGRLSESTGKEFMITQGYGLTETSPATHVLPLGKAREKLGSIGQLLPSLQARLTTENGQDAAEGNPGELLLKGPTVMKGYWRNKKANEETFTKDGWMRTGDVATVDVDGYWYIVDRLKEMIKVKGLQVAPAELEALLLSHPKVADSGVIAIKNADGDELPRAYITLRPDVVSEYEAIEVPSERKGLVRRVEEEVDQWVQTRVSRHKYLKGGVVVVKAIPRSASGKILRRQLNKLRPIIDEL